MPSLSPGAAMASAMCLQVAVDVVRRFPRDAEHFRSRPARTPLGYRNRAEYRETRFAT